MAPESVRASQNNLAGTPAASAYDFKTSSPGRVMRLPGSFRLPFALCLYAISLWCFVFVTDEERPPPFRPTPEPVLESER